MTHIPPADQRITPKQAYALAQLHAEMMRMLEIANWPFGSVCDVWVDTRTLSRKEQRARRKAQRERGAVYRGTSIGSPSGLVTSGPEELVAFAALTETDNAR